VDGPSSASDAEICATCFANGSAQTEQIAAILTRCGE
jgi:hypothetical protein